MSAEGERWEKRPHYLPDIPGRDGYQQGWDVGPPGKTYAFCYQGEWADAIVQAHNAAPGGREWELREALMALRDAAGSQPSQTSFAIFVAEFADAALAAAPAPAQTQDTTAGLAALAREMRGFTEQVWEAYANGVAVDFYDQARDLTERYDALVAQAETP